jgi:hypothetical protein
MGDWAMVGGIYIAQREQIVAFLRTEYAHNAKDKPHIDLKWDLLTLAINEHLEATALLLGNMAPDTVDRR